jgi:hypothetical protein
MHNQAMWPIHGKYICPQCLQEYPVAWDRPSKAVEYVDPALKQAVQPTPYTAEQRVC